MTRAAIVIALGCALMSPRIVSAQRVVFDYIFEHIQESIGPEDPGLLVRVTHLGSGTRRVYDGRSNTNVWVEAHILDAVYEDSSRIELIINPEFPVVEALTRALTWAFRMGQIPSGLRRFVTVIVLHRGNVGLNGGGGRITIHTDQTDNLGPAYMEEVLIHEATHAGLQQHNQSIGWRLAQAADNAFISNYARRVPTGEDLAETMPVWVALRYRPDRMQETDRLRIARMIPNRLAYLDNLGLDMAPLAAAATGSDVGGSPVPLEFSVSAPYPNPTRGQTTVKVVLDAGASTQVSVASLLGQTVAVLHDGYLVAGEHQFVWDTSSAHVPTSPGVYLIVGTSGSTSLVQSVIVQ
jgi:hypothetical protein